VGERAGTSKDLSLQTALVHQYGDAHAGIYSTINAVMVVR